VESFECDVSKLMMSGAVPYFDRKCVWFEHYEGAHPSYRSKAPDLVATEIFSCKVFRCHSNLDKEMTLLWTLEVGKTHVEQMSMSRFVALSFENPPFLRIRGTLQAPRALNQDKGDKTEPSRK
jgi:hypothetical protein